MPSTTTTTARDGSDVLLRSWAAAEPWASLVIVHGLGEHSGRWEHVGERLALAGVATRACDLRGFGGSRGRRAYLERWEHFHDDLADQLAAARADEPGLPLILYGHSMGAVIALGYALRAHPRPDRLVLSAPAVEAALPVVRKALARALGRIAPRASIANGIDPAVLSRDADVVARYRTDPLNHHRVTLRFGMIGLAEQARLRTRLADLDVPTLVLHAGGDRLVPPRASEPFGGLAGVTRIVYPDFFHEIHNEPGWERVVDDIVAWLRDT